jgi:hypothetical protein
VTLIIESTGDDLPTLDYLREIVIKDFRANAKRIEADALTFDAAPYSEPSEGYREWSARRG